MNQTPFEDTYFLLQHLIDDHGFRSTTSSSEEAFRDKLVELCDKISAEHGELGEAREIVRRYEEL